MPDTCFVLFCGLLVKSIHTASIVLESLECLLQRPEDMKITGGEM